MTKYREIIRLTGLGFSQRNIMASCGVAQKTVVKVQKRARELNISWPLDESMTDTELQRLMSSKESSVSQNKRMPDYDYIHKELLRNGVSKKLLWTEYMEDCRANGDEPLMYSQFCHHIQQDEQKRRATMHINRKPGEQIEVDWAGDPASVKTGTKKNFYFFSVHILSNPLLIFKVQNSLLLLTFSLLPIEEASSFFTTGFLYYSFCLLHCISDKVLTLKHNLYIFVVVNEHLINYVGKYISVILFQHTILG